MFTHNGQSIKVFTDGANLDNIADLASNNLFDGITTNPSLMRASGVTDYSAFCRSAVRFSHNKPISFEVLSDCHDAMINEAMYLGSLANNVYVKVPIVNTRRECCLGVINKLLKEGLKINITAVMSNGQIKRAIEAIPSYASAYISIFAGRIADTGRCPLDFVQYAIDATSHSQNIEIIWASTREVLNVYQALSIGTHIITIPPSISSKLKYQNYCLEAFSLDTVKMFKSDADIAGFTIPMA